ncbi:MAG: hypothetical protein LBM77_05685 [Spirochaetaceae bacterium]|jgi:hypothetical protein|nr:hypothetical protein [Spirochaetaceae bacterium]
MEKISFVRKIALFCAIVAAFAFVGCDLFNPKQTKNDEGPVDWINYKTSGNYSLIITNETNYDIVVFKDSISLSRLLGGVPKGESNHGLPANATLFGNQTGDCALIIITKAQFEDNEDDLGNTALSQSPFTRIYAAYNASGDNSIPWVVDGKLGGTNTMVLQNMTEYNMEIRRDSPRGQAVAYAPYQSFNTNIYLADGNYNIFPVFKKYNPVSDVIITMYPKRDDGTPKRNSFSFEGGSETEINANDYLSGITFTSGYAYLMIVNNSNNGVQVMKGNTVQKTATGIEIINPTSNRMFPVEMPSIQLGEEPIYAETMSFSGWTVGEVGSPISIATTEFKVDYMYTVTVSGDANVGALTVSAPVEGNKISF